MWLEFVLPNTNETYKIYLILINQTYIRFSNQIQTSIILNLIVLEKNNIVYILIEKSKAKMHNHPLGFGSVANRPPGVLIL